ncbi:delphilin-like [Watersipora subatra]|uniref:delphilin-like n=1 Tax=Watersipora subatra TaxID=2589382 RepID=UPI00355BC979
MRQYMQWPEKHGFSIGGMGPSYVLKVVKGSAADKQGLKVGDQILELDNHKVGTTSAPALETFAKRLNHRMPIIKVTNEIQYVKLTATRLHRFGLMLQYSQRNGFLVDSIQHRGPADRAGLKQGDLVTEVNGELIYEKSNSLAIVKKVLEAHKGSVNLGVLPCRRRPSVVNSHSDGHYRQHSKTARDLYSKINNTFVENYEKKQALIGVLKSYSKNENVEKLSRALVLVLQTPAQRKILPYIRLHIPTHDRAAFDEIIQRSLGKSYSDDRVIQPAHTSLYDYTSQSINPSTSNLQPSTSGSQSSLLYLRSLSILKGDGDLGVVMKGRSPVVIATVLANSAADKGGVLKGDCVLRINQQSVVDASHYEIQQLMKNAGPLVELEVMQQVHMSQQSEFRPSNGYTNPQGLHPLPNSRISDSYDDSTLDSQRSSSSSTEWAFKNSLRPQDSDPGSFKTQVNYLLEQRGKRALKQLLYDYNRDQDITKFISQTAALLDTPAKMTLWSFILPLLSPAHKEYTLQRVQLSDSIVSSSLNRPSANLLHAASEGEMIDLTIDTQEPDSSSMAAFKSQLEYLLTSQERKGVKRCLRQYREDKNIEKLVEELGSILDTQSKKSLWIHILALLPNSHQNYARRKISLPNGFVRDNRSKDPVQPLSARSRRNRIVSTSEDEFFVVPQEQDVTDNGARDEEDEATSVEILKYMRKGSYSRQPKLPGAEHFMENPLYGKYDSISISQEVDYPLDGALEDPGIYGYDAISFPLDKSGSYRRGRSNTAFVAQLNSRPDLDNRVLPMANGGSRTNDYDHEQRSVSSSHRHRYNGLRNGHARIDFNGDRSDSDSLGSSRGSSQLHVSQGSDNSYKRQVKQALQTMDDAVAGFSGGETQRSEQSDAGKILFASQNHTSSIPPLTTAVAKASVATFEPANLREPEAVLSAGPVASSVPVVQEATVAHEILPQVANAADLASPPPPPPPPLPPPPKAPPLPDWSAPLLVKRLNWETHHPEQIDQTVWGQVNSDDTLDIGVMVEYLELPQQFSTTKKKSPSSKREKKISKRKILHEKKAFNISIILASVNIPEVKSRAERDEHIEQALLRVEMHSEEGGGVLTHHLMRQLLQYAPSKEEVIQYKEFSGDLSELSEVDRFCYRMVRIPGYENRLKSMLFKATFDEKCTDVNERLHVIKEASEQIRQSKSFAKILELVLAMGNQLNKATNAPPAAAFKVSSLAQLDSTKTMDKKKSFLDVLVQAVYEKFPHLFSTSEELSQVLLAEKVTFDDLSREISSLQEVLQQITETMSHLSTDAKHYTAEDQFQEVMEHFVGSAEDRVQRLVRLQSDTMEEFEKMLVYLGEKPSSPESKTVFSTITHFLNKFDNCRRLFVQRAEPNSKSPRVSYSETSQVIGTL